MARRKSKRTAFVPKIVYSGACVAAVVPAIAWGCGSSVETLSVAAISYGSNNGGGPGAGGSGGQGGVFMVAATGFGVAAVFDAGFGVADTGFVDDAGDAAKDAQPDIFIGVAQMGFTDPKQDTDVVVPALQRTAAKRRGRRARG
jgi:hypothetical protein